MWVVIAGIVSALGTALITAYINRRSKSGKINTSEAKDLWDTLRSELARLQAETNLLRTEMAVARIEMVALREETGRLRVHIAELEAALLEAKEREAAVVEQLRIMESALTERLKANPVKKKVRPRSVS